MEDSSTVHFDLTLRSSSGGSVHGMNDTDSDFRDAILGRRTPVLEEIRHRLPSFSDSEARVARFIMTSPVEVMGMSISQLADASSTSVGSVARFCQRFGVTGYQQFKLLLSRTLPAPSEAEDAGAGDGDSDSARYRRTLIQTGEALTAASRVIDTDQIERVVDIIASAGSVLIAAAGTSTPLAWDTAYRMTALGIDARFEADFIFQEVLAGSLGEGDVCLAISHTGSTIPTLRVVETARDRGAVTVGVTSFATSPVTELLDSVIVAGSAETHHQVEAVVSRIVHLAVLDTLLTGLRNRITGAPDAQFRADSIVNANRI